jgi:hypothetical protein
VLVGLALGIGLATVAVATIGLTGSSADPAGHKGPHCVVTLYLIAPDGLGGEIIDGSTGGAGFSHVVAGGCEIDAEGRTLIYDCQPGRGVFRGPLADYEARQQVRIELCGPGTREFLGGLRAHVGRPYGPSVMCASVIRDSLPAGLRKRVDAAGIPASPNSIAAAFGILSADAEDIQIEAV